ncbi:MAG: Inhibitor of sigma-G Gin [Pelotomaculum sp. PtaB.Bin013]|uniref:sigma factor G inhibitor Gin n=1 Tax=Pelotomaculum isophthalicicum TaxID=342448 RepID=UPI0009D40873|nr:MAG: Inhibitor of sigma-G Gin [Pelotomaculum sp. PtaB.Bin013]
MVNISPICIICRQALQEGEQSLFITGHNICFNCENKIMALSADNPDYDYFIKGLKKIWCFPKV